MNTFDAFVIKSGTSVIGIQPQGAYVTSWDIVNNETGSINSILYVGSKIRRTGIPLLFPHFGKSNQYRMHGFGRDYMWHVDSRNEDSVKLSLTNHDLDSQTIAEYPYDFRAIVNLRVFENNSLEYSLDIENLSESRMPILPGLHPYWSIYHSLKSSVTIDGIPDFKALVIDWENNPPDNVYSFPGKVVAKIGNNILDISDISDEAHTVSNIVVWTQKSDADDINFICIEPVCGDHYTIDTSPRFVDAHSKWNMRVLFSVNS